LFAALAAGDGGAVACSRLLQQIAHHTPDTPGPLAAAERLWRAALAAATPPGALAGVGAFATVALPDDTWLALTLDTTGHTAALDNPDHIAQRCARHPASPAALRLMAHLVAQRAAPWPDHTVRAQARQLLEQADSQPQPAGEEHAQALEELRAALVNAGDIAAARRPVPPTNQD
jgi:hypothetical protein